jgi:predicted GNAT family N-acyltransferase
LIDLSTDCTLVKFNKQIRRQVNFDCGKVNLNTFFTVEALQRYQELLGVTYYYVHKKNKDIVCYFTVLNDVINVEELPSGRKKSIKGKVASSFHSSSFPAVKIGRLAVDQKYIGTGVGNQVLDFIKAFFVFKNKTGCRFITVDSVNTPKVIDFYTRNGFIEVMSEEQEKILRAPRPLKTRLLIYDLKSISSKMVS